MPVCATCYIAAGEGETQFNWVYVEHIAAGTVLNLYQRMIKSSRYCGKASVTCLVER